MLQQLHLKDAITGAISYPIFSNELPTGYLCGLWQSRTYYPIISGFVPNTRYSLQWSKTANSSTIPCIWNLSSYEGRIDFKTDSNGDWYGELLNAGIEFQSNCSIFGEYCSIPYVLEEMPGICFKIIDLDYPGLSVGIASNFQFLMPERGNTYTIFLCDYNTGACFTPPIYLKKFPGYALVKIGDGDWVGLTPENPCLNVPILSPL